MINPMMYVIVVLQKYGQLPVQGACDVNSLDQPKMSHTPENRCSRWVKMWPISLCFFFSFSFSFL